MRCNGTKRYPVLSRTQGSARHAADGGGGPAGDRHLRHVCSSLETEAKGGGMIDLDRLREAMREHDEGVALVPVKGGQDAS